MRDGLGGRIAAVLDGGACPVGLESTIVGFDGGAPVLLRPGGLPVEAIDAALGRPLAAPRRRRHHRAGPARLALRPARGAAPRRRRRRARTRSGSASVPSPAAPGLNLSPAGDLAEAAANLFAHLRAADALAARDGAARIAVAPIPRDGLGLAINDRLAPRRRAALTGRAAHAAAACLVHALCIMLHLSRAVSP